jgi:tRNA-dihydrouridine synthase A
MSNSVRGTLRPLSVAPMMERTDRHYRRMVRAITKHTLLYTEMVHAEAVVRTDPQRLIGYDDLEHPLALQLGGNDPVRLAEAAAIAEGLGYDEVNLNVGCPSDRVRSGAFGAVLMRAPEQVAAAVEQMRRAVALPVTVKHRIGVDELDRYEDMEHFVRIVAAAGCDRFTVHARKAWLQGLSPKENRTVPPLRYADVHRLKRAFPALHIEINGGLVSLDEAEEQLAEVDAVMIGRAAWDQPMMFAGADARFFGSPARAVEPVSVVEAYRSYAERWLADGERLNALCRPLLNLFAGRPGARRWRRVISENAHRPEADWCVVERALEAVS